MKLEDGPYFGKYSKYILVNIRQFSKYNFTVNLCLKLVHNFVLSICQAHSFNFILYITAATLTTVHIWE